jgi:hypothetical protein
MCYRREHPKPCAPTPAQCSLPCPVQEHQGNDPSTQLVPSNAAGGGWTKPEEPPPQQPQQPEAPRSALTAGSNWASQNRSSASGWVPPVREGPYAPGSTSGPKGSFPVDRHLNPEEYPSLAATAHEKQSRLKAAAESQGAQVGGHPAIRLCVSHAVMRLAYACLGRHLLLLLCCKERFRFSGLAAGTERSRHAFRSAEMTRDYSRDAGCTGRRLFQSY